MQNRSTFRKAFDGVRSGVMGNNNMKDGTNTPLVCVRASHFFSIAGVKKGYWLMSDLCEATQDPERNKQFILTFKDSTDPTRQKVLTYRYEAETPKVRWWLCRRRLCWTHVCVACSWPSKLWPS